jgi:transcriptional regulator GlxA family with amidase domain
VGAALAMTDVYFLVLPGTMLLDFAGTAETLRVAADFGAPLRLHYIGPADHPRTSIGLTLGGVSPLPKRLPDGAIVVIPGVEKSARDYRLPQARRAAAWLSRRVGPAQLLCTVCSGAFLAAESGLLDGHSCTTHHSLTQRLAREHPRVTVVENRIFVRDGNVLTSAGVTAGVDLALHLVSEMAGPVMAIDVARLLVLYFRRSGSDPQLSPWLLHRNHIDPRVHGAQDLIVRDPAHGWNVAELAFRMHIGSRHLGRLFRAYACISPLAYLRKVRAASARELLRQPGSSVESVAQMVGFSSPEQMRRACKRFEHARPADLRRSGLQPLRSSAGATAPAHPRSQKALRGRRGAIVG